jgi:putative membrane protein
MHKTKRALITIGLATATFFGGSSVATMQETTNTQNNQNNSMQNGNRRTNSNRSNGNRSNGNMSGGNMSNGNMSEGGMMNSNMGGGMMMGGNMTALDAEFAMMAAAGGQAEIQMAQLAVQRSTNRNIQKYAERMIRDHTKNARDLQKIAARKNMTLSMTPTADQMQMMSQLQAATGAEFDRLYMQMAGVTAHTMMRQMFTNQANNGTDEDLRKYARKTIPVIEKHLRMAQEMNMTGGSGGMMMNNSNGGMMNSNSMNMNSNMNRNSNRNMNSNMNSNNNNR